MDKADLTRDRNRLLRRSCEREARDGRIQRCSWRLEVPSWTDQLSEILRNVVKALTGHKGKTSGMEGSIKKMEGVGDWKDAEWCFGLNPWSHER